MKRTFVCASSCIKHYVQLSYGCRGTPVVALMCVKLSQKIILYNSISYKKYWNNNEKHFKNEQKVGMLLQNRTDTSAVGISSLRKSMHLLTTTPTSHTHRFHPHPPATPTSCSPHPLATPIHSTHSPQLSSILLACAKLKVWMTIVESGWNLWVWLIDVVSRRRV